jgi:hypothetical protein
MVTLDNLVVTTALPVIVIANVQSMGAFAVIRLFCYSEGDGCGVDSCDACLG